MPEHIDYDRGVLKRQDTGTGVDVYMYKDTPGVYLNAYGYEVSEKLAKAAGFDVNRFGKDKLKMERMAQARAAIEEEIGRTGVVRNIVARAGDFLVIDIGLSRHIVEDSNENKLTPFPLPLEAAMGLLPALAPDEEIIMVEPEREVEPETEPEAEQQQQRAAAPFRKSPFVTAKELEDGTSA